MENKNYHRTFIVNASAEEAMNKISQVNLWWKKDFLGSTEKLNDKFTVPFGELSGETSFVDFVISEMIPNRKVVWKVSPGLLPGLCNSNVGGPTFFFALCRKFR